VVSTGLVVRSPLVAFYTAVVFEGKITEDICNLTIALCRHQSMITVVFTSVVPGRAAATATFAASKTNPHTTTIYNKGRCFSSSH